VQEPGLEEGEEDVMRRYRVVVSKDPESNTYMASVPALRGCHTWGKTKEAAFKNAAEAIEAYLEFLLRTGK
jgi:predicted RNase H-like HicB family nuclease